MENKKFEDYFNIKGSLPHWNELPDIDLYVDQVISLMNKYFSFFYEKGVVIITHSMINNYVKLGIIPAPKKKKYSRVHLAYLIIICALKTSLSITDIKTLIDIRVKESSIEETLDFFSDYFDKTIKTVIEIGRKNALTYIEKNGLFIDTAIFMAIGSTAGKYISEKIIDLNNET